MRITWEQVTDSSIGSWEPVQKADCYRVYWADSVGRPWYRLMAETESLPLYPGKGHACPPITPGGGGEERRRNGVQ